MRNKSHIILTIDVEDWFQVENFKPWIPFHSWGHCDLRVEKNMKQRSEDRGQRMEVRDQKTVHRA